MRYCFPATFVDICFSNKEINDRMLMGLNLKLPHNEGVNTSIIKCFLMFIVLISLEVWKGGEVE